MDITFMSLGAGFVVVVVVIGGGGGSSRGRSGISISPAATMISHFCDSGATAVHQIYPVHKTITK